MKIKDINIDIENGYGEDSDNNSSKIQEMINNAKKNKPRVASINTNDNKEGSDEVNDDSDDDKKGAKEKRAINTSTLEQLGFKEEEVKQKRKAKEKANVYLKKETMDKLKTLSSATGESMATIIERCLEKQLEGVEVIESEVRKYNDKNAKRKKPKEEN